MSCSRSQKREWLQSLLQKRRRGVWARYSVEGLLEGSGMDKAW